MLELSRIRGRMSSSPRYERAGTGGKASRDASASAASAHRAATLVLACERFASDQLACAGKASASSGRVRARRGAGCPRRSASAENASR